MTYENGAQLVSSNMTSYIQAIELELNAAAYSFAWETPADTEYLLTWAYQSVMDAFQDYITGEITFAKSDNIGGMPEIKNTNVLMTILPFTNELKMLNNSFSGSSPLGNIAMKDALEAMFHNATLSLASQTPLLQSVPNLYNFIPSLFSVS